MLEITEEATTKLSDYLKERKITSPLRVLLTAG